MDTTVHELAEAVEAGIAHVLATGEPVAAAAVVVAATYQLDAGELEVCTQAIQICLAGRDASPPNPQPRLH